MTSKGFYFSLEALLGFAVLALIVLSVAPSPGLDLRLLYTLQKQHDLLATWLAEGIPELSEMESDFRRLFPDASGAIAVNGARVEIGKPGRNPLLTSAHVSSSDGRLGELSLVVYAD